MGLNPALPEVSLWQLCALLAQPSLMWKVFPPSCSLPTKQKTYFFSVHCLGVILQSFIQVGGEMGKEGIGIFHWDVRGIAALLAGLLDALVFFC